MLAVQINGSRNQAAGICANSCLYPGLIAPG
jgi:hypothetical protein